MLGWFQFWWKSGERLEHVLGLLDERLARAELLLEQAAGESSRRLGALHEITAHLNSVEECSGRIELLVRESVERLSQQVETVRLFASRLEPIDERSGRTEVHLRDATEALSKQIESVRLVASRIKPIDERSGRTEVHLRDATESLAKQIEAIRLFASRIAPIDERSARTERYLLEAAKTLSMQIEAVRLFTSRIEPIDERTARTETHLFAAIGSLSKQIEDVRAFASRIEPVDERSARAETHLLDATLALSKQIETVRLFASRLEPIDQRSVRIETRLDNLTTRLSRESKRGSPGCDLVRLHEICLFVPTNDNLYDKFIPQSCKGYSLEECRDTAAQTSALGFEALSRDVGKSMLLYLDLLFRNGLSVHLVDIGAWVGDVALRYAKFAKARGAGFLAVCYDPSDAGSLIPRNIALNGLKNFVEHRPLGVSLNGGPMVFDQLFENSDSSRLAVIDNSGLSATSYVVDTVTLAECLPQAATDRHVMVKIDVEGIDAALVLQNLEALRDATLIVEFAPHQEQYNVSRPDTFLKTLIATHSLFDIFYLPNPRQAVPVRDIASFVASTAQRPYGYTDVLAVPRSLPIHDEIVSWLAQFEPAEPSYQMA